MGRNVRHSQPLRRLGDGQMRRHCLRVGQPEVGFAHTRQHRLRQTVERLAAPAAIGSAAAESLAALLVLAVEHDVAVSAQAALPVVTNHLLALCDDDFRHPGLGFLTQHGGEL